MYMSRCQCLLLPAPLPYIHKDTISSFANTQTTTFSLALSALQQIHVFQLVLGTEWLAYSFSKGEQSLHFALLVLGPMRDVLHQLDKIQLIQHNIFTITEDCYKLQTGLVSSYPAKSLSQSFAPPFSAILYNAHPD